DDGTVPHSISSPSLHDALPIFTVRRFSAPRAGRANQGGMESHREQPACKMLRTGRPGSKKAHERNPGMGKASGSHRESLGSILRSEEHTSELQSRVDLVCRLLL